MKRMGNWCTSQASRQGNVKAATKATQPCYLKAEFTEDGALLCNLAENFEASDICADAK